MRCVGEALEAAGVRAIYLVHGTFAGTDALGLIRAATRFMPDVRRKLERHIKQWADAALGETGNYTPQYAAILQEALTPATGGKPPVPVRQFYWSSENHHVGRAHAAVTLVDELNGVAAADERPGRVLLWGHSHAGNVLALLTNLLAADTETLSRFFAAGRTFFRVPLLGRIDLPVWGRVRDLLRQAHRPIDALQLDVVTFGTPIRYGWDTQGSANLLHFINHRPAENLPDFRVPFPPALDDVSRAAHGDYFQQLGIAGTNIPPAILAARSWITNRRIGRLVQAGVRRRDLLQNLSHGMRVPCDGTTLLVDYRDEGEGLARHMAGHAVYTRREWMLFHATKICRRFYGLA